MSRHRDVRNLHKEDYDYDEYETEEAEYSDDEMDMAVAKVVSLIGNYNESEIKSSLIYYQMDIQRTANYLKSKQPPFGFHYLENMEKGNEIQLKQQSQTDLLSLKSLSLNPENQKPPLSNPSLDLKSLCKPSSNIPDLKSLSNQPKVDLKSLSKPGIDLKSLSASGFGLKKSDSPVNGLKSLGNLSMQINLSSLTSNPLNNDLPHSISSEPSKTVTFNNQSFHSKTPNFFAKPSDFAVCLCEDDYQFNSSLFIPNFFDSNYSYSAQAAKNKVKLFDFKSPSPDDIISNARSNKKDGI